MICKAFSTKVLMDLCEDDLVWKGDNVDERLRGAYVDFVQQCRLNNIRDLA